MLGVVPVTEYQSFVMADIPGIIEGAHQGKGLGHQFLQHIQRTSVLLFLIDINTPDPLEALRTLRSELSLYDPFLDKKPSLVVLSKLDTIPEEERNSRLVELQSQFQKEYGLNVLPISAVGNLGLEELKWTLYNMLDKK
jgi:GTP-binding protein